MKTPQQMIAALQAAGYTQQQIADKIGVHQATVSKIAGGADMMHSNAVGLIRLYEGIRAERQVRKTTAARPVA